MALTGIEIFKKLPKKNCGECGVPTCLAFAMSLAAGKAELSACPYVSEEAKQELGEASAPPIRPLTVGTGDYALKIGGETVMFRHEKTFVNPPGIAVLITDTMEEAEIERRLQQFDLLQYERVGLLLRPELIAIKAASGDAQKFQQVVNKVKTSTKASLILMSQDPGVLAAVLSQCQDRKPLLYAATKENWEKLADLAKQNGCSLVVRGENLDELTELTTKLTQAGAKDLVLDSGARTPRQLLEDQTIIRRAALLKKFRPLGFPTIAFPCEMAD
ncbi:MAG: acetyl-CoA decarbonylase/synthase complex subunit gamma, partial [Candidatus Latescibacteria bacterium]|nr:acetyl-CoA decarbonylase/synthase complex subunit gamma [Candidatus Latescibacterota bacterium]